MTDEYKYRVPKVPMEVDWIPFADRSAFMIFERGGPLVDQQGKVIYLATLPAEIWMKLSQTELPPGANPEPYPSNHAPAPKPRPSFESAARAAWRGAQAVAA